MSSAYESVYNMHTQQPMSRTDQYRKVMKPMLERKRRARINRCLDELKELMVSALATEGENVQKLEKADILEMTVQHLQKLKQQKLSSAVGESDRFRAGFRECALEVSRCLSSIPGVDIHLGTKLMTYLGNSLKQTDTVSPLVIRVPTPPCSPADSVHYPMPLTPSSSRSSSNGSPAPDSQENVWRPW